MGARERGGLGVLAEEALWVARAKAGDQAAFRALYERYARRIYGLAYRLLGDADEAHDLTQETFLKAYCALDKTDDELHVAAWLHRIAANACLDVLRRRRRVRWLPWEASGPDGPAAGRADDPEDHLVRDETRRAVRRVLDRMAPRHRQALVLREYEGLSCAAIGARLGVSRGAVKSLLFRGRAEFRRLHAGLEGPAGAWSGAAASC